MNYMKKCQIKDCNYVASKQARILIQHPTCKRWQTWKLCKDHAYQIGIDKFRVESGLDTRFYWLSLYKVEPLQRPVIQIGNITDLLIDLL